MTPLPQGLQQSEEQGDIQFRTSTSPTSAKNHPGQGEEEKEPMVTPKGTCYLSNEEKDSPDETNLPRRVQSTQSLLGLVGLEGHEESEDESSLGMISAVTEEQEVMDIVVSPTTPASPSDSHEIEIATCNTTPPGSVQGPGILSLSPPRLTTYSVGSVTSASVTENFVLQPRPVQSMQRQNHLPHESPRFSRSPLVQQPQPQLQHHPQPRSRPPRAPHHHSATPGGSNSVGGGPILAPRPVMGTGHDSSSISGTGVTGSGHKRTPTDATNYSFLSSLTDVSGGEYSAPRRRTLSWDHSGDSKKGGQALESKSLGGPVTSGSILQPILLPADAESAPGPPTSISASNLRKALPIGPGPTATTPTRPSLSSRSTSLLTPSALPSQENLHPLIQKLHHNVSHATNPSFISPPSHSKDDANPHPLTRKLQEMSPSKSGHTALTAVSTPFTTLQDEKKDDESSQSQRMIQQKPSHDRKSSDFGSYSSSFCSSSTIRLQKKTFLSPDSSRGAFERQASPQRISENFVMGESKRTGSARFDLADIMETTKECNVETDIIEGIELSNSINNRNENSEDEIWGFSNWPYLLLAWGVISLGSKGFVLNDDDDARFIFISSNFIRFCLVLGAATAMKRKLSKQFLDRQIMRQYLDELSRLRNMWAVLNEIAGLSTNEKENQNATETHTDRLRSGGQCVSNMMDFKASALLGKPGLTREDFIESSQFVYEQMAQRYGETELSLQNICEMAKLADGSTDRSKVRMLGDLFCPSRRGHISKLDFVKSTDRIFKASIFLGANVRNTKEICQAVDQILDVLLFSIAAILAPITIGVDISILLMALLCTSASFVFTIYVTSAESLRAILRLLSQKSYGIGDRVCFIPEGTETKAEDGPPSGGWIVESIDLYKTTLRQGITGERSIFSNDSSLFRNARIVNWKRSHKATLRLSTEFSDKTGSEKIDFVQRRISQWIEDRPCEWTRLESFRMASGDTHYIQYDLVLRHRESWYNYATVQDSKSDMLVFLRQLRNNVESC
eukprot:CAMPEP_0116098292 /NCGR_PEP_ID=MMETSP0327-20121206/11146_1 /TAXON_ID=44447 /ORGANISM="Pseudo-nitzschia delicatissima, Strain B596" /LENGTH=1019 /DNA_ID=CAMNT_0003590071 /DNA_START=36 /DNA_END=3095 /DNA_ORIENTATION=-